jgi:hypothetical protein
MSNNNDGAAAPADGGGSMAGGFLAAIGCENCWSRTSLFTRVLLVEGLLGCILSAIGLAAFTACCPILIIESYGLQFYRLLSSPLISGGILSGLFALFTVWQLAQRMEGEMEGAEDGGTACGMVPS